LELGQVEAFDQISTMYSEHGFCIYNHVLSDPIIKHYIEQLQGHFNEGHFRAAKIGKGKKKQLLKHIRSDQIYWLGEHEFETQYLELKILLDQLQVLFNRSFFLGIRHYEVHAAFYHQGAAYKKHYDQHAGFQNRVVTFVLYLNPHWQPEHGGQLVVYNDNHEKWLSIEPLAGRLVLFDSARYEHEVLASHQNRLSLTGWFRRDGFL